MNVSSQQPDVVTTEEKPLYERWEDLVPGQGYRFDDPYAKLSAGQLADLAMLGRMVRLLEAGKADTEGGMARNANRIREAFTRDGLDADWLLSQRETVRQDRIRRSRNPGVDGGQVRLLGLLLPLSWNQDFGVTEFLLTATLGTCSHAPPPPYNLVAHVSTAEPIDLTALERQQGTRDPWVWVKGTIHYRVSTHVAYRVDGMMRVDAAYSIDPIEIIPASAVELSRRAEKARQEAEALLYPRLADLVSQN